MFDTVRGLPLHVLVLHATVILVPLGALITTAVLLRSSWRQHYFGLLAAFNLGLLALTFITVQAGAELQEQLGGQVAQKPARSGPLAFGRAAGALAVRGGSRSSRSSTRPTLRPGVRFSGHRTRRERPR